MTHDPSDRLPSLNALRAFESAARHLSFTHAAKELHVTPAAIGHQIRTLEDYFGITLFVRRNRGLELTESARTLLPGLSDGFSRVSSAVDLLRREIEDRPLVVSIVPVFGKWLLRRLDGFRELHSGIDVRIDATERVVDFARDRADVAIRYGDGDYPGLHVDRLIIEEVYPVCSPALLEEPHPLREPADLQYHPLLDCGWNPNYPTWPDWRMWLKAADLSDLPVEYGWQLEASSSSEALALEEAVAGRGVALASNIFAADDLDAGRLVRPFDVSFPVRFGYWLVCPESTADMPKTRVFREWLLGEVATFSQATA